MIQIRLVLAATILLSKLAGMAVASSIPVNTRSLGLSARHINIGARVLEQESTLNSTNVAEKSTKRTSKKGSRSSPTLMSKKSKKISSKDDYRLKLSKKGSSHTPSQSDGNQDDDGNSDGDDQTDGAASSNSVEVQADVFQLFYSLSVHRKPSEKEYQELAQITSTYLEQYMTDIFGDGLQIYSTFMVFQGEYNDGEPVRCDYGSAGLFREDLFPLPTTAELNNLISAAFSGPNLQNYLAYFNNLSSDNVFQTTDEVALPAIAEQPKTESSSLGIAAGALVGALVLVAGATHIRRRKKNKQGSDADKLNGEGSDAGTIRAEDSDAGTIGAEADDDSSVGGLPRNA